MRQQKSLVKETLKIYRRHGIPGFYRGMMISTIGIAPLIGVRMSTYDLILFNKTAHNKIQEFDPEIRPKLKLVWNAVAGASAGLVAVSIFYPGDVLRRLM
jgi:hypothetical protein